MADVVPTSTAETIVVVTSNDQEVFSFDFLIYSTDQIRVILRPNSGAPERELVYPYDFSVSGLDQNNGGYITTIGVSVSVNDEIYMWRDTEIDREKDWAENGDYKASLVNREQNEIYMILQELARDLRSGSGSTTRRGAMFPMGYAGSNILPTPEGGKLLSWADDMSAIINRDIPGWISGSGRPLQSVGRVGDFYLDIITADVYGAKTASGWGGVVANIRGTRGAQGIQGIQGVRGVQGVPGIQGVQGIQGQQGAQGTKGDTGEKGEKGEKGDKGDTGLRGIQGVQGAAGEKGDSFKPDAMGLAVERSLYDDELKHFSFLDTEHGFLYFKRSDASGDWTNGTAFTTGAQGAPGVTGEQGVQGERGEKGDKGDKGEKGEKGDAGEKGEQGIQGIQGVQGIQGIQGEQGEKGEKGDSANFFDTKSSVQITSIPVDVSYINIIGSDLTSDGGGGLYIDSDNGSSDTITSADGRVWYRVKDVGGDRVSDVLISNISDIAVSKVRDNWSPSPMDYGAKGDGITDDYPAIVACMTDNNGRVLSGRGKTYYSSVRPNGLVMEDGLVTIDGTYISGGSPVSFKQSMSFAKPIGGGGISIDCAKANYTSAWAASLLTSAGAHAGGLAFDEVDKRWYAQYERADGNAGYIASYNRWFGDLTEFTKYPDNARIGHQGFALDRLGDGTLHAWTSHRYDASARPIAGRQCVRFKLGTPLSNIQIFTLFGEEFSYVQGTCMPSVSPCNRYLVAVARKNTRDFWVRVFDLHMLIEGGEGDYSDKFITQWGVDPSMLADGEDGGLSPCQNMVTDGKSVFFICGNAVKQKKTMAQYDLMGRLIEISHDVSIGLNSLTGDFYEPQALAVYKNTYGAEKMAMLIITNPGGVRQNTVWELGSQTLGNFLEPANSSTIKFVIRGTDGAVRRVSLTAT